MCIDQKCLEDNSVKALLQELLQKTLQNAQDHFEDFTYTYEPESIHQYRVNLRTVRSVCNEFSPYLDSKKAFLFEYLKVLQKETNDIRDIDVFIECIEDYKTKVSSECLGMCYSLEKKLLADRKKSILELLSKDHCAQREHLFKELCALHNDQKLYRKRADKKVWKPLHQVIMKRIEKIQKLSNHLSVDSPNTQFHTLRLHYKKIRYTTDSACFGIKEFALKEFAASFKPIQTVLGEIQDKNVQLARLSHHRLRNDVCVKQVMALIEEELKLCKQRSIEQSSQKAIKEMKKAFKILFIKDAYA